MPFAEIKPCKHRWFAFLAFGTPYYFHKIGFVFEALTNTGFIFISTIMFNQIAPIVVNTILTSHSAILAFLSANKHLSSFKTLPLVSVSKNG
jgi:hypothetical protein